MLGQLKSIWPSIAFLRNGLEIKTNSCGEEMNDLTYIRFKGYSYPCCNGYNCTEATSRGVRRRRGHGSQESPLSKAVDM